VRPEVPWIADFRDPYLIDSRFGPQGIGRLVTPLHRRFERTIYDEAALVLHAIPLHARWARRHYAASRARIEILTNGCPTELAEGLLSPIDPSAAAQSIRAMGVQDAKLRAQLVRAVAGLIDAGREVELRIIGRKHADFDAFQQQLGRRFVATGQLAHRDALGQLLGGDVLVNAVSPKNSRSLLLSSKLFEYLACGKPVVAIKPSRPDRHFLRPLQGVRLLDAPSDVELLDALRWALRPEAIPPQQQTDWVRREYSRRSQSQQLATWLDEVVGSRRARG
jgi:hypothetical protein